MASRVFINLESASWFVFSLLFRYFSRECGTCLLRFYLKVFFGGGGGGLGVGSVPCAFFWFERFEGRWWRAWPALIRTLWWGNTKWAANGTRAHVVPNLHPEVGVQPLVLEVRHKRQFSQSSVFLQRMHKVDNAVPKVVLHIVGIEIAICACLDYFPARNTSRFRSQPRCTWEKKAAVFEDCVPSIKPVPSLSYIFSQPRDGEFNRDLPVFQQFIVGGESTTVYGTICIEEITPVAVICSFVRLFMLV